MSLSCKGASVYINIKSNLAAHIYKQIYLFSFNGWGLVSSSCCKIKCVFSYASVYFPCKSTLSKKKNQVSCLFPLHAIQKRIKGTPGERAIKRKNLGMTHHGGSALKRVLVLEKLSTCTENRPFFPGADL